MTNGDKANELPKAVKDLAKLRRKAEICRYAHSCMMGNARWWRRMMDIVIAVLTLGLSAMAILFYRKMFPAFQEWLVFGIGIVPILILFAQSMGKILGWAKREADHTLAVHIWGMWIRDAGFFMDMKSDPMSEMDREKISTLQKKYLECMEKTPSIPNRKFLLYKIAHRRRCALAAKIDAVEGGDSDLLKKLDGIERECVDAEQKNRAATRDKEC